MSLFPRQGSVHSTRCQVWEGARVSCPHLPAPLFPPRLSYSSQSSVPLCLCHCLSGLLLRLSPAPSTSTLGPSPLISSFTYSSLTEFSHHSGVLAGRWSACVHMSLGHCLLVFLLPPCLCDPFHFCCVFPCIVSL